MSKKRTKTTILDDVLANGKMSLPAQFVINKMGSSVIFNIEVDLKPVLTKKNRRGNNKSRKSV